MSKGKGKRSGFTTTECQYIWEWLRKALSPRLQHVVHHIFAPGHNNTQIVLHVGESVPRDLMYELAKEGSAILKRGGLPQQCGDTSRWYISVDKPDWKKVQNKHVKLAESALIHVGGEHISSRLIVDYGGATIWGRFHNQPDYAVGTFLRGAGVWSWDEHALGYLGLDASAVIEDFRNRLE
jgi:hypothetical protein